MVCRVVARFLLEKPLFQMGCGILLGLTVPVVARLAGNNDPNENQISHVFGQDSICVAMDFPGWVEVATIMFFFAGLLHSYAMIKVYQHCKSEWKAESSKRWLLAFVAFEILCVNCFWMVGLFSPVLDHSVGQVFAHTIPFIVFQFFFFFWVIFLMAFVPPKDVSKIRAVSWYCISLGYVVLQLLQLGMIFHTLALLAQPGVETSGPNRFKGPLATEQASLQAFEPVSLFARLTCLCLHPLRLPYQPENPKVEPEDPDAVTDFKAEEV